MRDLAARLREVVRREHAQDVAEAAEPRDLTYVPEPDPFRPPIHVPRALGGTALDPAGACVVVERRYDPTLSHGRRRVETCVPDAAQPLHLFDGRAAGWPEWWRRVVFFDIETTGLSGGAGTLAFLAGCGWFDDTGGFVVRQFLLAAPSGERDMLDALAGIVADASLVVTFNGRTFDVPFMETRWAFHRKAAPTDDLAHFDMLPPARRLWARREMAAPETEGCSLAALERRVLGYHRVGDVPGFEIPARYFQFLRTGDPELVSGVLEHNRQDLVSLAAVMAHALWMAAEGPDACREPAERVALGRIYEAAGDTDRARDAYERADATGDAEVRRHALARLARMHRRAGRHADAAGAWQQLIDLSPAGRRELTRLERCAVEALAIHHEHRAKDPVRAQRFAEALGRSASGRQRLEVDRRLDRLRRKAERKLI